MFAEFDLIQINYEVLWREAIVESAATNNSYMVVFDNSNPTIVPRNQNRSENIKLMFCPGHKINLMLG